MGCVSEAAYPPKAGAGGEHLVERQCRAAGVGGEGDIRQPVGDGDSDLGARGVQVRLGLKNIRALLHEL